MEVKSHPPPLRTSDAIPNCIASVSEDTAAAAAAAHPSSTRGGTTSPTPAPHATDAAPALSQTPVHERRRRHGKSHASRRQQTSSLSLPVWERCRVARMMAVRWMAHLMQSPPEDQQAYIESYRARIQQSQSQTQTQQPSSSAAPCSSSTPAAKSTQSQTFLDAVRSGGGAGGGGISSGTSSSKVAPIAHPPAPPPLCLEPSSSGSTTPPISYNGLELVPENTGSIPPLLHALREIALSCSSLDALNDAATAPPPRKRMLKAAASAASATTPPRTPHVDPVDAAGGTAMDCEEQWRAVRAHFHTVRRLVLNQEELAEVLDSTLGAEWRPDDAASRAVGAGTSDTDNNHNNSSSTGQAAPLPAATTAETNTANSTAAAGNPAKATTSPPTPLNYKAPPFHSRSAAPSSDYSPSQHVASFLLERQTPTPKEGCSSSELPQQPHFPTTPPGTPEALPTQSSPTMADGPAAAATTNAAISSNNNNNNNAQPRSNNASSSAASSPSMAFHLESREDMLRRRHAAPNAFYLSGTHNGTPHYLTGPHSPGNSMTSTTTAAAAAYSTNATGSPTLTSNNNSTSSPSVIGGNNNNTNNSNSGSRHPLKPPYCPGAPRSLPVSPIMTYSSPVLGPQCPYDYILVIDFEATCEEHFPPGYLYEIIEFPVVLVDVRLQRVVAEFHRFVRPRVKTELSTFCKHLTGITQSDVDEAAPLEEVIRQFERWYHQTVPHGSRAVFATDGPMDFKEFLYKHSVVRQGIRFPQLFYQWIDVKQVFANFFSCQQGKIRAMLEVLHRPFEGRLHSGIDDARNIASIVTGLLQWGCTLCEVPLNMLPLQGGAVSPPSSSSSVGAPLSSQVRLPPPATNAAARSYGAAPLFIDDDDY